MYYAEVDDHAEFRDSIEAFMSREAPPQELNRWEREGVFPAELYKKMADLGWVGLALPEEYGGSGAGPVDVCVLAEEVARRGGYEVSSLLGLPLFGALTVFKEGTDEQRKAYLPAVCAGDLRLCVAYTEPDTGSDAAAVQTRAVADGPDRYILTGEKSFITGAHVPSTVMIVTARTNADAAKHKGLSLFLVPNDAPGVRIDRLPAMGRNMLGFNLIHFHEVVLSVDQMLGPVDEGWRVLMSGLEYERSFTSAGYVGAAQAVVDLALSYAKERQQFGRPIGEFQAIAHLLVDMQTQVDAARGLLYRAATLLANGKPCTREVSQAKLVGSETFVEVAGHGVQIMGAHGYVLDSPMQRHLRDARSTTIAAGTSQIHRNIIARALGLNVR